MVRNLFMLCCTFMVAQDAMAQSTGQLWLDGTVYKTFASYYRAQTEFGYRTLVSGGSYWESYRVAPRMEIAPTPHWTFMVGAPLVFTQQQEGPNSYEARLQLGAKYDFTPFKRVRTRLYLRYEYRSVKTEIDDLVQNTNRARLRAEVLVPLNTDNHSADTMWYALGDVEAFIGRDQDVDERFANRARVRIGAGRKFSYNWRVEAIYTLQESRNSIEDTDPSVDNIIRLRLKYYITPRVRRVEREHHTD
ncbi:MAG: DUF2490 domain-containing protein [Flavobacteriales bacterium]